MRARVTISQLSWLLLALAACGDDDDVQPAVEDAAAPSTDDDAAVPPALIADAAAAPPDATSPVVPDAGAPADATIPTPVGQDGYLLVGDLEAGREALHAFSLPDLRHTGQLDGVRVGNHVGAIALADGRVVLTDDAHQEVLAIRFDADGKPVIAARASADLGDSASWGCGDKDLRYLAIGSGKDGLAQVANVLDTASFTVKQFPVTVNDLGGGKSEELHPAIAGEPLHLLAAVGGEVRAYLLSEVLAGSAQPRASVAINTGSHGPVVSHTTGTLYITTAEGTGFDGVSVQAPFARAQLIPWDVDGLATGRNARPRLSYDGRYILGAIAQTQPTGAERWSERKVDLHVADLTNKTAKRSALGAGTVSKFQLAEKLALFAEVAAEGDSAILVDADASSPGFGSTLARVPLTKLTSGPVVGQPTAGKEARGSALTPDGKWGFVSHGGDGLISVVDTAQRKVAATITLPTALKGGGYLFAVQPGKRSPDTCMR